MKKIHSLCYCNKCRGVFMMEPGDSINDTCPCGASTVSGWMVASGVIDALEDQQGLQLLIRESNSIDVQDVADALGYHGPICCDARDDNSAHEALKELENIWGEDDA